MMNTENYVETIRDIYTRVHAVRDRLLELNHADLGITGDTAENQTLVRSYLGDYVRNSIMLANYHSVDDECPVGSRDVYSGLGGMVITMCCALPDLDWSMGVVLSSSMSIQSACNRAIIDRFSHSNPAQFLVDLWCAVGSSGHGLGEHLKDTSAYYVTNSINKHLADAAMCSPTTIIRAQNDRYQMSRRGLGFGRTIKTDPPVDRPLILSRAIDLLFREHTNEWGGRELWDDLSEHEAQTLSETCVIWRNTMGERAWDNFSYMRGSHEILDGKLTFCDWRTDKEDNQ